jgi:signal transduction histidine kinase
MPGVNHPPRSTSGGNELLVTIAQLERALKDERRENDRLREEMRSLRRFAEDGSRFRGLVNAMPDLFFRLDRDGCFLDCLNPGDLPLLARSEHEVIGRTIDDLLPAGLARMTRSAIQSVLDGGAKLARYEYHLDFDGEARHFEARICPDGDEVCILVREATESQSMSDRVLSACEAERRRIGEDLHDGTCQQLVALSLRVFALEMRGGGCDSEELRDVRTGIEEVTRQVRTIAHEFHPVEVRSLGLEPALQALAAEFQRSYGIPCELAVQGEPIDDPWEATHLYRIVQEAIGNAGRHAGAARVRVSLVRQGADVELRVEDDGCGLERDATTSRGIGLATMQHRTQRLGGTFEIGRIPSGGTRLICRFLTRSRRRDSQ